MVKALLILILWTPGGYGYESYPLEFKNRKECERAAREIKFRAPHRMNVVLHDIVCDRA